MSSLRELVLEANKLEKKAGTIQLSTNDNSPVGTNWSQQRLDEFADEYHLWYAEGLAILPNDLKDQFRTAYEGHGGPACIKRFIESPLEKIEIPIGNGFRGVSRIRIAWKYPYDTNFRKPFLAQKRILTEAIARPQEIPTSLDAIAVVDRLARNFHLVVHQLKQRHADRPDFITDEFDVQDLFHAMLMPFFEDIRPEEWTPSYAAKSSRVDFLLKQEQIVVEIKKTRDGLTAKEIADQLIIDKDRYRSHPDCKTLIAFVYDPDKKIANPRGLENDLSQATGDMNVRVIINQG